MRASHVLSLFAGLVLASEAASLPILGSIEESQLSKRGGRGAGEGHSNYATFAQNANSHLSTAAAHVVAGISKVGTMPTAGLIGAGRHTVNLVKGIKNGDETQIANSITEGVILNPIDSTLKTVLHPLAHGDNAVKSVGLAAKNYVQAAAHFNGDNTSRHMLAEVKTRPVDAWKNAYRGPIDQAMKDVYEPDPNRVGAWGYGAWGNTATAYKRTRPFFDSVKPSHTKKL
jgi:hypothetical protein